MPVGRGCLLASVMALGCLPDPGPIPDGGDFGDAPAEVCGFRRMACCESGSPCRGDGLCRAGQCVAPTPRCVETGVANVALTQPVSWEVHDAGLPCTEIPALLIDDGAPGIYWSGERSVGRVECEGLTPGVAQVRFEAHVHPVPMFRRTQECSCGKPAVVVLDLVVNEREHPTLRYTAPGAGGQSCRAGIDAEATFDVPISSDGRLDVRLDLTRCHRDVDTRCLFSRGTSISLDLAP